jgi:hypothetical protein
MDDEDFFLSNVWSEIALRRLLENFELVGNRLAIALLRRPVVPPSLRENVHAAIVASTLGLSSLDYTKKRYSVPDVEPEPETPDMKAYDLYIKSYAAAKEYVYRIISKLQPEGVPPPRDGVFGASLVLQRLPDSFFSAHILYLLGYRYEGHAVARLILEQIAWAYAAVKMIHIGGISRIVTTKAVSQLRKALPAAGKLYGYLSEKAHIDYSDHHDFLFMEKGRYKILRTQRNYGEYSSVLLSLADLFGIVYELSQFDYIPSPETLSRKDNRFDVDSHRPFLAQMKSLLQEFDEIPGNWRLQILEEGIEQSSRSILLEA